MRLRLLLTAAMGFAICAHCEADTVNVPGDFATIQAAISDSGTQNGDEVVVAPGTYNELIDFLGKAITVRSSDGAAVTTIDGAGLAGSVVTCDSGEVSTSVLDGFTIENGQGTIGGFASIRRGGGMINILSSPTVLNCIFQSNSAVDGGAIYNEFSHAEILNCTFNVNTSNGGNGSAICSFEGSVQISQCEFTNNSGGFFGGATFNGGGVSTISTCSFIGNNGDHGGAICNQFDANPQIINCSFFDNSTAYGGGIYNENGSPTIVNCTFSRNTASIDGGAVFSEFTSIVTITNSIAWWGIAKNEIVDFDKQASTSVTYSNIQNGWTGPGANNLNVDPLMANVTNGDFQLRPGSSCIDAGNNNAIQGSITTDVGGCTRIVDDPDTIDTGLGSSPIVDMGAHEFQPCPEDIVPFPDGNGAVDVDDMGEVFVSWNDAGGPADINNDGIVDVDDLGSVFIAWGPCPCPTPPLGPPPCNPNGVWQNSPSSQYSCNFGNVSFNISQWNFSQNQTTLTVTGAPTTMTGNDVECENGNNFSVTGQIPGGAGGCTETYTLTGTFTGPDQFTGTFTAQYTGTGCVDCANQNFNVTGSR